MVKICKVKKVGKLSENGHQVKYFFDVIIIKNIYFIFFVIVG